MPKADVRVISSQSDSEDAVDDADDRTWLERNQWVLSVVFVFLYLLIGSIVFVIWEGWDFLTAMYVVVQIITTVGYGDITVHDGTAIHWFMTIYVFLGIAIIANIVNDVSEKMVEWQTKKMRKALKRVEKRTRGARTDDEPHPKFAHLNQLLASIGIFFFFLLTWALFFRYVEGCTCSYGVTKIDGCNPDLCESTNGTSVDMQTAIYGGVITFTTVGFGDVSPKSHKGRVFSIVWMVLGVLACGNVVTNLGSFIEDLKKHSRKATKLSVDTFNAVDQNGNGSLGLREFQSFFLLQHEMVCKADLANVAKVFEAMDKDGSGKVTLDEIENCIDEDD